MEESKSNRRLKILLDGVVKILTSVRCKMTCCKSSCNITPPSSPTSSHQEEAWQEASSVWEP